MPDQPDNRQIQTYENQSHLEMKQEGSHKRPQSWVPYLLLHHSYLLCCLIEKVTSFEWSIMHRDTTIHSVTIYHRRILGEQTTQRLLVGYHDAGLYQCGNSLLYVLRSKGRSDPISASSSTAIVCGVPVLGTFDSTYKWCIGD
jgi:hypothetical protein